jgi:hypothetical protein
LGWNKKSSFLAVALLFSAVMPLRNSSDSSEDRPGCKMRDILRTGSINIPW